MERRRGLHNELGRRNIIGPRVKQARLSMDTGLSITALSRQLLLTHNVDLAVSAISKIEAGTRYATDYEVAGFARALGVSADWLLGLVE